LKQPDWIPPMLATLTDNYFSDPNWIYERKLDGERVMTYVRRGKPELYSRNKILLNGNYPEVVDAFAGCRDVIVDGEVVAFDGRQTSFAKLQPRMQTRNAEDARRSRVTIFYYVFDCLYADRDDIRPLPVRERKKRLRASIDFADPLRFMTHRVRDGEAYHDEACRKGWEGVSACAIRSSWWRDSPIPRGAAPASARYSSATTRAASCATRARWEPDTTRSC
jgi:ATP-dependent DNA ligase